MSDAAHILERQFLEMRARCLALGADLDRIQRSLGGEDLLKNDPRLEALRRSLDLLKNLQPDRAERIQMIFSDVTPAPR